MRYIAIGILGGVTAFACTSDDDGSSAAGGNGANGGSGGSTSSGGSGATDANSTAGAAGSTSTGGSNDAGASGGGASGGGASSGSGGASSGTGGSSAQGGSGGSGGSGAGSCTSPSGKGPCDTVPQCGCLSNQNCDVTGADGTTECVATGSVLPWNACTDFNQCPTGYSCVSGACHAFCEAETSTCPGLYASCVQPVIDGAAVAGMYVCTRTCNPADPSLDDATFDACGPGLGCYPTMTSYSDCYGPTTATGIQWAYCGDLSGNPDDSKCAPGYFCSANLSCLKYCVMQSAFCPGVTQCFNFNPVLYAGDKSIGYCS